MKTNEWKLGLFVVSGLGLAFASLVWLGANQLERDSFESVVFFDESVDGSAVHSLDDGALARFATRNIPMPDGPVRSHRERASSSGIERDGVDGICMSVEGRPVYGSLRVLEVPDGDGSGHRATDRNAPGTHREGGDVTRFAPKSNARNAGVTVLEVPHPQVAPRCRDEPMTIG